MKKLLFILLLCLLAPSMAGAMENEPAGFRGIKFGSHFDLVKDEMTLVSALKGSSQNVYFRKNDELSVNGSVVEHIAYRYYKNQLFEVTMELWGLENCQNFFVTILDVFGRPDKNEEDDRFVWTGKNVKIIVSFAQSRKDDPTSALMIFYMYHTPILDEINEIHAKRKREQAGF